MKKEKKKEKQEMHFKKRILNAADEMQPNK